MRKPYKITLALFSVSLAPLFVMFFNSPTPLYNKITHVKVKSTDELTGIIGEDFLLPSVECFSPEDWEEIDMYYVVPRKHDPSHVGVNALGYMYQIRSKQPTDIEMIELRGYRALEDPGDWLTHWQDAHYTVAEDQSSVRGYNYSLEYYVHKPNHYRVLSTYYMHGKEYAVLEGGLIFDGILARLVCTDKIYAMKIELHNIPSSTQLSVENLRDGIVDLVIRYYDRLLFPET